MMRKPMLHHIGIVVPSLDSAVAFYTDIFNFKEESRTDWTTIDGGPLGIASDSVRLRWAFLSLSGIWFELHEFQDFGSSFVSRETYDPGLGHLAFRVSDIHAEVDRLSKDGKITFFSDPNVIEGLPGQDGDRWVYGRDPYGLTIELYEESDFAE